MTGDPVTASAGHRRGRGGFSHAGALIGNSLGRLAQRRGLGEARILSAWAEIVGPEAAALCSPRRILRRGGQGGTLVVAVAAGRGPELSMLAPTIVERVNACLGWKAVARLRLEQTMPDGLAEAAAPFDRAGAPPADAPDPAARARIAEAVAPVEDAALRAALERLGRAILARNPRRHGKDRNR
ncbi:MAG: hypothetical protein KatS3mg118_0349 [Paracoccaceae bacterium]|nr:MAG: hypothetical protein KatS3mg118_0349 [Paracoccaceae bacterium]